LKFPDDKPGSDDLVQESDVTKQFWKNLYLGIERMCPKEIQAI
jgi:hypothetical protein